MAVFGLAGTALLGCEGEDDGEPASSTTTPTPATTSAAATSTPTTAAAEPKPGGFLRQADGVDPTHFSPLHQPGDAQLWSVWRRHNGYWDCLWHMRETTDPSRLIKLRLASSIEPIDELTYVAQMHPARFHNQPKSQSNDNVNGRTVSSEDVVAQYDFLRVPPAVSNRLVNEQLTVTAVDELTVRFETSVPAAFFYEASAGAMVRGWQVPREMLDEEILKTHAPIGTGPFMFSDIQQGSSEEAVRNPDYFLEGRPYLDGKRFTLIPDAAAREAAFRAGELDHLGFSDVRQADSVTRDLGERVNHISFPAAGGMALMTNIRRDPFRDIRAREAFHRALDVDRVINTVFFGDAERSWWFAPGNTARFPVGFEAVKEYVAHDKEHAAQLLAASDYDGRPLQFLAPSELPTWIDSARLLAEDLTAVGFNIAGIEPLPRNVYLTHLTNKPEDPSQSSDFDIAMSAFQDYDLAHSNTGSFLNNVSLEDPEVDAVIDAVALAIDPEQRKELSQQFELLLAQKYSNFVPVLSTINHVGWNAAVKGYDFEISQSGVGGWQPDLWFDV